MDVIGYLTLLVLTLNGSIFRSASLIVLFRYLLE